MAPKGAIMPYKFILDLRDILKNEGRLLTWLIENVDDNVVDDIELYEYSGERLKEQTLIPRDDPKWDSVWSLEEHGFFERRRIKRTEAWRWVERSYIVNNGKGVANEIWEVYFEISDEVNAMYFKLIFNE
jgi:hypothetical protein